ncbi:hypothetical protein Tco_0586172 [Tanacetum coccineum]
MSEEDQNVDVGVLSKFDMPLYSSEMTVKDVKSLALWHDIPLDLHPVALTKEWTMDRLPDDMTELYEQYFKFLGIRVPFSAFLLAVIKHFRQTGALVLFREEGWRVVSDAMAWRLHDSNVNDPVPEDGFSASDVQVLTEQVVDLRPVPSGLLFLGGLASTWDFPGFRPVFKDTEGHVVTMSEYLRFPFMSGGTISQGYALTSQDQIAQHTARPLPPDQAIPEKTDHQKIVEVEDSKIVAIRERKAKAAAKKRERKKQGSDGGEGSRPATKRRKTAARKDGSAASEATSSPEPLRIINPTNSSVVVAETTESREDHSPRVSPRSSADHSVHNYDAHHGDGEGGTLWLGASGDPSGRGMAHVDTEAVRSSPSPRIALHSPEITQPLSSLRSVQRGNIEEDESSRRGHVYVPDWAIHQRCRLDTPMWCRELMVYLAPLAAQVESNALMLSRGLEPCRVWDLAGKLVQSRLDIKHSSDLYNSLSKRSGVIMKLEDTLAKKDSALVYAERLSTERAQEKEKLVTQLGKMEMEKFDCVRKLLPTVVERLLQSHEYKCSLSEPFNLAIQARWRKGLAEERSEEALLELMGRMEGFDVHADTKMKVEYDKLFEKRYPYVEKISRGFRHSVSDLLKVYPDSAPSGQAPSTAAPKQA